jgi:hypothetical protein
MEVKKLVRKAPSGKWWYTLRWTQLFKSGDGSTEVSEHCFDSALYNLYRDCLRVMKRHKNRIENKEA